MGHRRPWHRRPPGALGLPAGEDPRGRLVRCLSTRPGTGGARPPGAALLGPHAQAQPGAVGRICPRGERPPAVLRRRQRLRPPHRRDCQALPGLRSGGAGRGPVQPALGVHPHEPGRSGAGRGDPGRQGDAAGARRPLRAGPALVGGTVRARRRGFARSKVPAADAPHWRAGAAGRRPAVRRVVEAASRRGSPPVIPTGKPGREDGPYAR